MWDMQDHPVANDRVTVAGHFIVNAGAIDAVLALWTELIEHVRAHEPGTELYLLAQDVADPAKLWLHEEYQDEAAFVAHGHSPVIRGFVDRLAPLIAERHLARTRKLVCVDRSPG
jgi:quinol monooxygenase YgiN